MERGVKKYVQNKAIRDFLIRSAVLVGVVFAIQLSIAVYFRHLPFFRAYLSLPGNFYYDFLTGLSKTKLINSIIFIAIAFLIYIRHDLLDFKRYKQNWKETAIWGISGLAVFLGHYVFKYYVKLNLVSAVNYSKFLTFVKLVFNLGFIVLFAYAVYNKKFTHYFVQKFWKAILSFMGLAVVYYFVIEWFQKIWFVLSVFVSKIIYFLLSLTYADAMMRVEFGQAPTIGAANFIVGISKDCSGIDSLLLFLSLFIFLWVLNRDDADWKKMLVLFVLGIIGTLAYNLVRVYMIMLIGIHYDPRFAIDVFHTNAGWIMFLLFFGFFWHFGSNWVFKGETKPKSTKKVSKKEA